MAEEKNRKNYIFGESMGGDIGGTVPQKI